MNMSLSKKTVSALTLFALTFFLFCFVGCAEEEETISSADLAGLASGSHAWGP